MTGAAEVEALRYKLTELKQSHTEAITIEAVGFLKEVGPGKRADIVLLGIFTVLRQTRPQAILPSLSWTNAHGSPLRPLRTPSIIARIV